MKIAVAMSGGIDSSAAVGILLEEGHEVFGVTMRQYEAEKLGFSEGEGIEKDIKDAEKIAEQFGIKHYVIDIKDYFDFTIVRNFLNEYQLAKTPNPCILCNKVIKFGYFMEKALNLGADKIATGHYIKSQSKEGTVKIFKGTDKRKDQSYMMWSLSQEQLSKVIFPLGNYKKSEIREIAAKYNLIVKDKKESQEICFIKDDYISFLKQRINPKTGKIIHVDGKILGEHKGLPFYTIGQRKGLGLTWPSPLYVKELDFKNNSLIVTDNRDDLVSKTFFIRNANWTLGKLPKSHDLEVKVRYNTTPKKVKKIIPIKDYYKVILEKNERAITPGQSAVFYKDDLLIGGGFIEKIG